MVFQSGSSAIEFRHRASPNEVMGKFIPDGSVELYHDGNKKLDTTIYGIDVTGTVSADGLTVSGIATLPQTSFTGDVEVQNL